MFTIYKKFIPVFCVVLCTAVGCGNTDESRSDSMPAIDSDSTSATDASTSNRSKSVPSADGVDIHYDLSGNGDTLLVFVHGWSCDRSYWREQIEQFTDDYTVATVDLAGHGSSGAQRQEWTMAAFGADVAAVAHQENAENVVLVGHSMGGPVILEAARLLGPRVKALIAVDTLKRLGTGTPIEQATQSWSFMGNNFAVETEKLVRARFFLPDADAAIVDEVAKDMASAPPESAVAMGIGLTIYNSIEGLQATAAIPLYLLNASYTPTDMPAYEGVRDNVYLKEFATTGHFPMLDAPAEFNAVLKSTLDEVRQY